MLESSTLKMAQKLRKNGFAAWTLMVKKIFGLNPDKYITLKIPSKKEPTWLGDIGVNLSTYLI